MQPGRLRYNRAAKMAALQRWLRCAASRLEACATKLPDADRGADLVHQWDGDRPRPFSARPEHGLDLLRVAPQLLEAPPGLAEGRHVGGKQPLLHLAVAGAALVKRRLDPGPL